MRIYVASSWRNLHQPSVVEALRRAGHEVYDFRNPAPDEKGFSWASVDEKWMQWNVEQFSEGLRHSLAQHAFERDRRGLEWCDVCVLVLPSGMSAHLEAGWCAGRGKTVVVYAPELREAELMYLLFQHQGEVRMSSSLEDVLRSIDDY